MQNLTEPAGVDHKRPSSNLSDLESDLGPASKRVKTTVGDVERKHLTAFQADAKPNKETTRKFNEPPFTFLSSDLPQVQSVR